ncbi:hypothetical protein SNOG_01118 [Parastagonospora nodorum SN15]|uniref:Uncharacterized protein n=1 Tax=Phaeosphaeria nodorum (strain SN15 / ATCC MYA-4574 / FGSC 10173) TaxID=321614 RepID=Q0V4E6_PHANO|nr:hypothetical protein SNOG_01118 [Parastagonospora nodorum SN15]EAT92613.1 hypothetical protein SNOG_01118 [Parastagonospora nodorum SN15]
MVGSRGYTVIANVADPAAAYPEASKRLPEESTVRPIHLMGQTAACPWKRIWRESSHSSQSPRLRTGHTARTYKAIPVKPSSPTSPTTGVAPACSRVFRTLPAYRVALEFGRVRLAQ